jgi:hypothetical protein
VSKALALFVHACVLVVASSGVVYAWMLWFAPPADEWSVVGHPWQPFVRHLHILAAPCLLFAVGAIWRGHVWERLRNGRTARRRTGLWLAVLFLPMAASGHLLAPLTEQGTRKLLGWIHVGVGVAWCAVYVVHLLLPRENGSAAGNGRHAD